MARVVYSRNALANLEGAFRSLDALSAEAAVAAVDAIRSAIEMLEHHPLIGRIVEGTLRELVISFGRSGHLALYRFVPARREIRILAIRHQRELDYP
ncbi:MAG TPA: type II toxin-antitoxin system RelE/ParE family toxin [Kofleriaceae bacterium]|nr:type II toxin-antitoxin system RelE/ParE family toxin [Kofleriaceae bacterium]